MKRRDFFIASAAAFATTGLLPGAAAATALDYAPGVLSRHLDAGETVFLDFKASWCGTCKAQERAINALKSANPAYAQNVTFINVDWDLYGKSRLVARMRIPRRSTLVVLKGDDELGRLVAETREEKIRELMDTALNAATEV